MVVVVAFSCNCKTSAESVAVSACGKEMPAEVHDPVVETAGEIEVSAEESSLGVAASL